jgi:hypothetical protein
LALILGWKRTEQIAQFLNVHSCDSPKYDLWRLTAIYLVVVAIVVVLVAGTFVVAPTASLLQT